MPKIPASQGGKSSGRSGAPRGGGGGTATAAPRTKPIGKARVSRKALTQFTSQLSTLQDAGLPIVRSLKILGGQMERGPFKSVVVDVTDEVESGSPLSEAMSRHPGVFDGLYTNMVKAGEAGGVLDVILARLSGFMEKADVVESLHSLDLDRAPFDLEEATFFIGRESVIPTPVHTMAGWRERLFASQLRAAAPASRFFGLPSSRVVEVGSQVEI